MDASDNKSSSGSSGVVDIIAAVLSNMNKELPPMTVAGLAGKKRNPLDLVKHEDADLDELERSDSADGSEKKDESTEKKATNTSNETGASGSSCRDDSDVDIYVSASNKLVGYRYTTDELLEIATAECCKSRPEFFANELFKVINLRLNCCL